MQIVRKTRLKLECGCYWYKEFDFESEALAVYHALNDALSAMMLKGIIGDYKLSLSNERYLESDDEEE